MKLIFSLLFKANYEECMAPPAKKARDGKTAPSVPAPMQPGFKLKREWTATNPAEVQDREIAGPVAQEHSDAAPSTLQHSLPGPSGAQVQPGYKPVSIFSYLSISSNF